MKEEQRVYIKGVENRGEDVIKSLTDLGGINSSSYTGDNEKALYYINPRGKIEYIYNYEFSTECLLVKEFYREITLPKEKWTDGDLLVKYNGGKKEYIVYSDEKTKFDDEKSEIDGKIILSYIYVYDKGYATMVLGNTIGFKKASKDDIKEFQKRLHKYGKEWSFKYKMLVPWKWELEDFDEYWYVNEVGEICHTLFNGFLMLDLKRVRVGNCFQTKDDAITARDKIAKILLDK